MPSRRSADRGGTVSDNCSPSSGLSVTHSDAISGQTCTNRFTLSRTYTVTDACNNSSTCTQTITVNDTIAPAITQCATNVTVQCAADVPAAATDYASFVARGGTVSANC